MKIKSKLASLFVIPLFLFTSCASAQVQQSQQGTPVLFPTIAFSGSVNNRPILVVPDPSPSPLLYNTNLVAFQSFTLQPVNGQVIQTLLPWGYTVTVFGSPHGYHIVVPNQTNLVNAASLVTNGVAIGFPFTNLFGGMTSGFSGVITNLASSSGIVTNYDTNTIVFLGAGDGTVNGNFIWNASGPNGPLYYCQSTSQYSISSTYQPGLTLLGYGAPEYTNSTLTGQWGLAIPGSYVPAPVSSFAILSIVTNQIPHFNITTFTNGVCLTNWMQ